MSRQSNLDSSELRKSNALLRRTAPPICAWCGEWIDRKLPATHAKSWTADHVVALADGGHVLGPRVPMHRDCNSIKGSVVRRPSRLRAVSQHPSDRPRHDRSKLRDEK